MPGVTYERQVQFTSHGPVAVHVLNAPKPGGAYSLKPVLSNGADPRQGPRHRDAARHPRRDRRGRQRRPLHARGRPPERDADAGRRPPASAARGPLDARHRRRRRAPRPEAAHVRHLARDRAAAPDGPQRGAEPERDLALHARPGGPRRRPSPARSRRSSRRCPRRPRTSTSPARSPGRRRTGTRAIPPGGAVLSARGTAAQRLLEEAPVGTTVTIRLLVNPDIDRAHRTPSAAARPSSATASRSSAPTSCSRPRRWRGTPRTGVGQLADGRIVMVVVDGRRPGYWSG